MNVDAHQHYWDRSQSQFDHAWQEADELKPICKSYLPADLHPHLVRCGVDKTVFVQTQHDLEENRWALALAEEHDWIAGVVGWVDLASEKCEAQLGEFLDHPKFVGVRHIAQDEPDVDFIMRDEVMRGLKVLEKHGVPFDQLFYVKHLHHSAALGQALPELPMVIDHLAKPEIKAGQIDDWKDNFIAASKCENIYCKLSGLVTEADWKHWTRDDLKPYVDLALDHFGPERCMFGSDWPVCELAATYEQVHAAMGELIARLSADEQAAIWGQTAIGFYHLDV